MFVTLRSFILLSFQQITLNSNLPVLLILGHSFLCYRQSFSNVFMSKVERGLLYDGFKAVCDSSIAWLDLLLVEGTSPPIFSFFFPVKF